MDNTLVGWGAAVLAAIMTFAMPVSGRRVNQALISLLIVLLCFVAAFSLLEPGLAFVAAIAASALALIGRGIARFVRHASYEVTKYGRRDYWYRRAGRALFSERRRRR